ncbi:MAG: GNAT family N-acetyltransferase [Blastochloris sp.]|nr:GNAT family N-acetyltransferase [Blastochloris sp.]
MAARLTQIDYDREMALVLVDPFAAETDILGVMRISADADGARAEYAGAVRSDQKGEGFGRLLLEEIIGYAAKRGIAELIVAKNRNRPDRERAVALCCTDNRLSELAAVRDAQGQVGRAVW